MKEMLIEVAISMFVVALVLWAKWHWGRRHLNACAASIPGPPTLPLLGNALYFMCGTDKMLQKISDLVNDYGPAVRFWLGSELSVIVSDPADVELLLMSSRVLNKGPSYKYMQQYLGQGLLSGSGSEWRTHRKIINPAFHIQRLEQFLPVFNKHTTALITTLHTKTQGEEFNIFYDIIETTTNSVFETILGYTKDNKKLPFRDYIVKITERIYEIVFMRMTKLWYQIDCVFKRTQLFEEQESYRARIRTFSAAIIEDRLSSMKARSQTNENTELTAFDKLLKEANMSESEMLDEVFTLFTRSQEASATISSFVLLMLALHPEYQEKVFSEVLNILGDEDRDVSLYELNSMLHLDRALKEVLRLFPIGALLQRQLYEDFEISTCTIPAGSSVVIPVYQIHRHSKYWDEPEKFDPERFNPKSSTGRHPFAYIPFSAGPMNCVGRKFAIIIVKTICCRVLREFRVKAKGSMSELKLKTDVSVRPLNGYYLTLERRL